MSTKSRKKKQNGKDPEAILPSPEAPTPGALTGEVPHGEIAAQLFPGGATFPDITSRIDAAHHLPAPPVTIPTAYGPVTLSPEESAVLAEVVSTDAPPCTGVEEYDWLEGFDYLWQDAETMTADRTRRRFEIEVKLILPTGAVLARCTDRNSKSSNIGVIQVVPQTHELSYGCSCRSYDCCQHIAALSLFVIEEMNNVESTFRRRAVEQLGLVEDPSMVPGNYALSILDLFLTDVGDTASPDEPFELPGTKNRIVWRVSDGGGYLSVQAVLQKRRKRGDGWTKGKAYNATSIPREAELSDLDHRVAKSLEKTFYSLGASKFAAIDLLVGHDLVEVNGKPGQVVRAPFTLEVAKVKDSENYELRLANKGSVFSYNEGLAILKKDLLQVIRCGRAAKELASIVQGGDLLVPASRINELLERLQPLSESVNVKLPTALAKKKKVRTQPVLRLRFFSDSTLRCGLRVRDGQRLERPGEGNLTRYESTDKGLLRQERDAMAEVDQCREILTQFDIDPKHKLDAWDWGFRDSVDAFDFLATLGARGDELGIEPVWDEESVEPVNVLGSITPANVRVSVERKKDWFGIEGGVEIGGAKFSLPELLAAVDNEPASGFTELRPGMWAKISQRLRKRLQELRDAAHANRSKLEVDITAAPLLESLRESELDIQASAEWDECVQRMTSAQKINPKPSSKFNAELREYQLEGYRWMRRLAEWGVGACLADDMGLGKTVQTLAVLLDRAKKGPTLVIAPTSVGFNWERETERFTPTLRGHLYRDTDRKDFLGSVKAGDVVICSYGLALRDAEHLANVSWGTLVLDEAQFVKNARSKTAQAIRTIPADWKLALTGTPIENHLGELWSLFRMVSPGVFGSWEQFRKRFAAPIERQNCPKRRQALSRLIQPFVLRRTKSEVLTDLPERTEINLHVELSPEERARYDEMRLAAIGELDEIVGLPDTNDHRFRVLAILTRLRQMACHVGLVDEQWQASSSKLELLLEKVNELKEEGHRVLIFSQFTTYLGMIREKLEQNHVSLEYLDGSTPAKARQKAVDRFQEGETDAFLISLKAGGTGLNLTAADYVIHMDPWWNPAVEDQATDRSHRIGQTRPVIVYRIISTNTVEDQILSLHADKRDLVSSVMEGTQKAGAMSTNELVDLIRKQS